MAGIIPLASLEAGVKALGLSPNEAYFTPHRSHGVIGCSLQESYSQEKRLKSHWQVCSLAEIQKAAQEKFPGKDARQIGISSRYNPKTPQFEIIFKDLGLLH